MALRLGFLCVSFGELLDPGHHAGRRHPEQLGGAVHRQPAQVQQHRRDLDPQRHAARRGVGEVQPAGLAAVALQPLHEPVLDVLLSPATLAPQPHRPAPPAVPLPTDIGHLRCLKTLYESFTLNDYQYYLTWERIFFSEKERFWTQRYNILKETAIPGEISRGGLPRLIRRIYAPIKVGHEVGLGKINFSINGSKHSLKFVHWTLLDCLEERADLDIYQLTEVAGLSQG